jgi:putative hydrolase of the HAD superfamily
MIKAVLWDLGGVITTSPFEAFNAYERDNNLPRDFIRMTNSVNPDGNAWARFEKNEITMEEFDREFERETRAAGHPLRGSAVLALLAGKLRPEMTEALRRCSKRFKTACLTNNVEGRHVIDSGKTHDGMRSLEEVMGFFDVVIESSKIGIRKPDQRFYEIACNRLGIAPSEAVYLDDLGINLKPARALGMTTIKVVEPIRALRELEGILGVRLTT